MRVRIAEGPFQVWSNSLPLARSWCAIYFCMRGLSTEMETTIPHGNVGENNANAKEDKVVSMMSWRELVSGEGTQRRT